MVITTCSVLLTSVPHKTEDIQTVSNHPMKSVHLAAMRQSFLLDSGFVPYKRFWDTPRFDLKVGIPSAVDETEC